MSLSRASVRVLLRLLLPFLILLLLGVPASASDAGSTTSPHPLRTALNDSTFSGADASVAFARTRSAGATFVRFAISWREVAPPGAVRPAGFDPADPAEPAYRWDAVDRQVKLARANRLEPIIYIQDAPLWAQAPAPRLRALPPWIPGRGNFLGNWMVNPRELAKFSSAAAKRYSGSFEGLPRVRYWQVWNEPDLGLFLNPQLSTQLTKAPTVPFNPNEVVSPDRYRDMVNAFAAAVHAVHRDNVVIAGGLAPFSGASGVVTVGAYLFMRKLLCLSKGAAPKPTCDHAVHFDVWSTHPYTSGGPTHRAGLPDDVSLGDLPRATRLLNAAVQGGPRRLQPPCRVLGHRVRLGLIASRQVGSPPGLHARWVAEALYRMWANGVTLVAWFGVRDEATNRRPHGSQPSSRAACYSAAHKVAEDRPQPAPSGVPLPVRRVPVCPRDIRLGSHSVGEASRGSHRAVAEGSVEASRAATERSIRDLHDHASGIWTGGFAAGEAPRRVEQVSCLLTEAAAGSPRESVRRAPGMRRLRVAELAQRLEAVLAVRASARAGRRHDIPLGDRLLGLSEQLRA